MYPLERILQGKTTEIQTIEDPKLPTEGKSTSNHEIGEQDTLHSDRCSDLGKRS